MNPRETSWADGDCKNHSRKAVENRRLVWRSTRSASQRILEREVSPTIKDWMSRVESNAELTALFLSYEERTSHLSRRGDRCRRSRCSTEASGAGFYGIAGFLRNELILRKSEVLNSMTANSW